MHSLPTEEAAVKWRSRLTSAVAPWWHAALLVALFLGLSFFNMRLALHGGLATHHVQRYCTGIAAEWIFFLLTWWGLRGKRVPFSEILGFRRGFKTWMQDLGIAVVFWIAAVIILAIISLSLHFTTHLASAQKTIQALAPRNSAEILLWIVLSLSAGFCEEFIFRGYFFRQFSSPIHRIWLGVLLSSLLFGLGHGYEGAAGMIAITAYGALFCGLALLRNSLRPGMIAHAWHDIFTGILLVLIRHAHLS